MRKGKPLKYIPVVGNVYRDWTVITNETYNKPTNRNTYWRVRCKCGFEGLRAANHLVSGHVSCCKSCSKLKQSFEKSYLRRVKDRARVSKLDYNIDLPYVMTLFNGKCTLSGVPIVFGRFWTNLREQTASLDRIDICKGYVKGNVQWVHKDVNFMKGMLTQDRFLELCNKITYKK